jgi:hypothetical protein
MSKRFTWFSNPTSGDVRTCNKWSCLQRVPAYGPDPAAVLQLVERVVQEVAARMVIDTEVNNAPEPWDTYEGQFEKSALKWSPISARTRRSRLMWQKGRTGYSGPGTIARCPAVYQVVAWWPGGFLLHRLSRPVRAREGSQRTRNLQSILRMMGINICFHSAGTVMRLTQEPDISGFVMSWPLCSR